LAKHLGATVTTTASPRGRALVERLGADRIIDYTAADFTAILDQLAGTFDGAFDLLGGDTLDRTFPLVRRGATVVSIAGIPEPQTAKKDLGRGPGLALLFWLISGKTRGLARRSGTNYRYFFMHPSGPDLEALGTLVDAGQLEVVVDRTFPFASIADAFAYLETGRAKGKVVVSLEG
ncbi:MAG TPA: zinc-binding dehydrogenase, partial [Polyangiaceae bacterium]|nr:zinc-binding dehydrogenase [Polyangiaceae bacterium]